MTWLDRQSFLGPKSVEALTAMTIGFVGLGGGGSHAVQQLAHAGVGGFVGVDHDRAASTNRNRLIGMTPWDALLQRRKAAMAKRLIRRINPRARVRAIPARWEEATDALSACDLVVGAVDTFKARAELEGFCRAHLTPYCDLGMDVHPLPDGGYFVGGQVALSLPGDLCMWCMGLLTDANLAQEASRYGKAGPAPQVVWTNGALASMAVNLIMQLFTPWHDRSTRSTCIELDANRNSLCPSPKLKLFEGTDCRHYPVNEVGSPLFDIRLLKRRPDGAMLGSCPLHLANSPPTVQR
jgi:hypothetical protein